MAGVADKIILAIAAVLAVVAIAWIIINYGADFLKSLLPNKDAPAANQTGTTASGSTIVGSNVKYVNPALCVLTGQFCDPNKDSTGGINDTTVPVVQAPPDYATFPTAQALVAKMNAGTRWTSAEVVWAKANEPMLWKMYIDGVGYS
ncbi:hypothetical protein [uncultured Methanoregula sp.]|uniref:hypothetical protein n=1 Tax=uncultured Methanoregula sp. TaxID=1005933 RepID=UPI002AAA8BA6|nr:hypothetical protein [uncultured Methanoregula sp.]